MAEWIHSNINSVLSTEDSDFYISYNESPIAGGKGTALVRKSGKPPKFLILMGDHREAYTHLFDQGYDACFQYFVDNIELIEPMWSEVPMRHS